MSQFYTLVSYITIHSLAPFTKTAILASATMSAFLEKIKDFVTH